MGPPQSRPPTGTTAKRIQRELRDLQNEKLDGMTLHPSENDLYKWEATIPGPVGSLYEGEEFKIAINLSFDYPFSAPKVHFISKIYHMNISKQGQICLDILKDKWSPALSLHKVLLSISSLFTDPNPDDPLVPEIAHLYKRDRAQHDRNLKAFFANERKKANEEKLLKNGTSTQTGSRSRAIRQRVTDEPVQIVSAPSGSRSRTGSRTAPQSEVINISDDEVEVGPTRATGQNGRQGRKRKRTDNENSQAESRRRSRTDQDGVSNAHGPPRTIDSSQPEVVEIDSD